MICQDEDWRIQTGFCIVLEIIADFQLPPASPLSLWQATATAASKSSCWMSHPWNREDKITFHLDSQSAAEKVSINIYFLQGFSHPSACSRPPCVRSIILVIILYRDKWNSSKPLQINLAEKKAGEGNPRKNEKKKEKKFVLKINVNGTPNKHEPDFLLFSWVSGYPEESLQ